MAQVDSVVSTHTSSVLPGHLNSGTISADGLWVGLDFGLDFGLWADGFTEGFT